VEKFILGIVKYQVFILLGRKERVSKFRQAMQEAGFSQKQMEFLEKWVAQVGHLHSITDILRLKEELLEKAEIH
jgi:hypothetical protein